MGGEKPPPLERSLAPEDLEGPPVLVEEEASVSASSVWVEGDFAEMQFAP